MPFLLLLVVAVACMVPTWPAPGDGPVAAWAALAWAPVVLVLAVTFAFTRYIHFILLREPENREAALRRYGGFRGYHIFALIGAYGLTMFTFGWGWVVTQSLTIGAGDDATLLPAAELGLLLPFLVGLLASWACFFDVERAVHDGAGASLAARPFWTRREFVFFHAQQNLALVVAPVTLLVVAQGLLRQFPALRGDDRFPLAAFGLLIGVFICLPWVLRFVLGLQSLPAGPLRERLLAEARRLRFRCSDVLLWNTHGGVANAMVVGVLPAPRYVVMTDRLIDGLTDEELEAVFGHEVGHVKHFHMIYYLGFLFMSLIVLALSWRLAALALVAQIPMLEPLLEPTFDGAELPLLPLVGLYIFVVFGFLSRRCERQADIYGCRAVSCARAECASHDDAALPSEGRGLCPTGIATFISALEKVACLNGMSRSKPGWFQSWQHSTIARRVEFLQRMLADPTVEPRFQRRVGQVKWALFLGLGTLLVLLCVAQG